MTQEAGRDAPREYHDRATPDVGPAPARFRCRNTLP